MECVLKISVFIELNRTVASHCGACVQADYEIFGGQGSLSDGNSVTGTNRVMTQLKRSGCNTLRG